MAQRKLTQKEWDQANDLSDELMTVMVGNGTSGGVSPSYSPKLPK